ncbi:MAG: hypothetical protein QGG42_07335 [Phycisphaerae bacterium]|nr:hypothetical protein [Phycisphaerae bacterium]
MNSKKTVFPIVKVLTVVVILAVVGACVIPQFRCICDMGNARMLNLVSNLQTIRSQLELYREHHNGTYPVDIVQALTRKTDIDGTINPSGYYGPYLRQFPGNPLVVDPVAAVKTTGAPGEGWNYDPATGVFLANEDTHVCYKRIQPVDRELLFEAPPNTAKQQ